VGCPARAEMVNREDAPAAWFHLERGTGASVETKHVYVRVGAPVQIDSTAVFDTAAQCANCYFRSILLMVSKAAVSTPVSMVQPVPDTVWLQAWLRPWLRRSPGNLRPIQHCCIGRQHHFAGACTRVYRRSLCIRACAQTVYQHLRTVDAQSIGKAGRKMPGKKKAAIKAAFGQTVTFFFLVFFFGFSFRFFPPVGNKPLITPRKAANRLIDVAVVIAMSKLSEKGAFVE
jgi:hypothetical protein